MFYILSISLWSIISVYLDLGSNNMSWGWDIGRKEIIHQETVSNYPSAGRMIYRLK